MLAILCHAANVEAGHFYSDPNAYSITLKALSALADACLRQAVGWAEASIAQRFGQALDGSGEAVNLLIIGMGKLGGYELNVSSDIDLIFTFRDHGETTGPKVIDTSEWCVWRERAAGDVV